MLAALRAVNDRPTEAQKQAGNYAKGHVKVLGFDITVENPRGSMRRGIGANGEPWAVRMGAHYGYFKRTEGADGDHVDVYVGPHLKSPKVFVVDQVDAENDDFDEHKVMLGFASYPQARNTYVRGFSDGKGEKRIGAMTEMTVDQFRRWLKDGNTAKAMTAVHRAAGGRVGYAPGGEVDDWTSVDDWGPAPAAPKAAEKLVGATASAEEKPATGLLSPITDIPREIKVAGRDALSSINANLNPLSKEYQDSLARKARGEQGWTDPGTILGTGKGLLSAAALPASLITGPARSLVGHPYAGLTGMPYDQARDAVDTAMAGIAPRGFSPVGARAPGATPPAPTLAPRDEIAAASERLGVPVPVAGATDSLLAQRTAAAAKEIPIIGDPLVKASRRSMEALGTKAEDVASQYGSGNVLTAGDAAKTAISDWITGKSAAVNSRLYDRVDKLVDNSLARPLHEVQGAVGDILARRIASGTSDPGKAVNLVAEAVTKPGGLTYQGVKDLRTRIGSYLDGSILPEPGTSMPDLKKLYGALTKDLRGTVFEHGGPDALAAFDKANRVASLVSARREALAKVIGKDASTAPEGVLDRLAQMASTKSNADITRLAQARKAIGPKGWDEVASSVISRIGRDAEGNFSPDRFVTGFGKLSDEGKTALFGSTGRRDLVQALDDIATISSRAKQIARFGNPSGTGRIASLMAGAGALFTAPLPTLATAIGGNMMARVLARPVTAKATANWMKAYQRAQLQATPPSQSAYAVASSNLARSLAQIGLDPARTFGQLQGLVPGRADEQQQ